MRYKTLAGLQDAYQEGLITDKLMLDNDSASVYREASNEDVFEMHPDQLLREALDLLGIPFEHV